MPKTSSSDLLLNSVLGFLGVLLLILLFGFVTRILFPRIQNERSESQVYLIGDIIQLEVLNGCGVPDLATRFTNRLRQNGFDVVETGNFETFDIQETFIIDRSGNMENALKVAKALGISEQFVIQEIATDFYLDATVVIGSDYKSLNLQ